MAARSARENCNQCCRTCKKEYADSYIRLCEVLLPFLSGILTVVTFGTPFWSETTRDDGGHTSVTFHVGLWQNCTRLRCEAIPYVNTSAFLMATRAFMCLALGAGLIAWTITIVALLQHRARWLLGSALCYAIQGFFMLIGLSTYSKQFHQDHGQPFKSSWSYTVGWIAFLLSLICCICFVMVGAHRLKYFGSAAKEAGPMHGRQDQTYAPLAQFESTGTSDEEDDVEL